MPIRRFWLCVVLVLAAAVSAARSQDGAAADGAVGGVRADEEVTAEAAREARPTIRFSLKEAPYDMVLDLFSRQSGLPVIREADAPAASMTFISAQEYSFDEALTILNLNLRVHGLHLRVEENFLYLSTLGDAVREGGPVAAGAVPDGIAADQMLTLTIPLNNATAAAVAEQVAPLVGEYGRVTAVETQNMVIVFETAEQCRRIQEVIQAIDAEKPADSEYRLFPLKHAQAAEVVEALVGLVGQRQRTVIIDEKGKQRVVEDNAVAGLNIRANPRTNAVVAVGPSGRLDTVEELISLLDTPDGDGGERTLRTFALRQATAEDAARTLESLFRAVPESRRPTVVRLDRQNKVSVLASASLLMQAEALVRQLDGGGVGAAGGADADTAARVVRLANARPDEARRLLDQLLPTGVARAIRVAQAPGGAALVLTGPAGDVEFASALLESVDATAAGETQVRVVPVETAEAVAALRAAEVLFGETRPAEAGSLTVRVDESVGAATLIGPASAIDGIAGLLDSAGVLVSERAVSRTFELGEALPSRVAEVVRRVLPALLDGASEMPTLAPVDELATLVVRGRAADVELVAGLVAQLDTPDASRSTVRIVDLSTRDAAGLVARATELYEIASEGRVGIGGLRTRVDEANGRVLVIGSQDAVALFDESLRNAQRLVPPDRVTRLFELAVADPAVVAEQLVDLVEQAETREGAARPGPITARALPRTDTLVVDADPSQLALVERFVDRLDRVEVSELPPLRLLQVRTADASSIAAMLNEQYRSRPPADRASDPVDVRSDAGTNTLIVSASDETFEQVRTFVRELNSDRVDGPERVTVLFPLKVARAVDVAAAMEKVYPPPPVPLDRRGRPMTWLRQPSEVNVSAEPSSNALIIDAPAERVESLKELASMLDRVELPPVAQLRTYRVVGADINAISATLRALAQRGNLSAPAQLGAAPVAVVIEAEPVSGTLIVAGDDTTFERVEAMLDDLAAVPVERRLRVVPVANAEADDVRERAMEIYDAQIAGIPDAGAVDVSVDAETNSLMVVADDEAMERFIGVLDQLQQQVGPARETRLIELRFATPVTVVAFLKDLRDTSRTFSVGGGAEPVFEAIEQTNSVLVAAQPAQFPVIEQLVRSVDGRETAERTPLRILKLRTTDAASLASILRRTYSARPMDDRLKRPVDVEADAATNTLVVSAHEELLPEIEGIVDRLNTTDTLDEDDREVRIFPLVVARAEELARTLDAMFPQPPVPVDPRTRRPRPDLQLPKEVVVRADRGTNALIVDAPARRLAGFEQLVKNLDRQEIPGDADVRTYQVRREAIEAAAGSIRELASGGALGGSSRTPVTVSTEGTTGTLIVSGPSAAFEAIEAVLDSIDGAAGGPEQTVRIFPLAHARATRLVDTIRPVAEARLRTLDALVDASEQERAAALSLVADAATNTLVVTAPSEVQVVVETLLVALDAEAAAAGAGTVRVVPLTFGEASAIASLLPETLAEVAPSASVVSATALAGSNAVLLAGPATSVEQAAAVVAELDQRPTSSDAVSVKTFTLEHADAASLAPIVQRVLTDQRDADPRLLSLRLRFGRGRELLDAPAVRVEAEPRSNALLVSAPQSTMDLAQAVVLELDRPAEGGDRSALTYTPSTLSAAKLVERISPMLAGAFAPARVPLRLTAVPEAGVIVATGTPEQAAGALRMAEQFDAAAPVAPASTFAVFELAHADAATLAQSLTALLRDRSAWPESLRAAALAGGQVAEPVVAPDAASARVVVSGPEALGDRARVIVASLDRPRGGEDRETAVIALAEGRAETVAAAVGESFGDGRGPTLSVEPTSNSIVVVGTPDEVRRVRELAREMDSSAEPDGVAVRTIFLRHAEATAIAPIIERILKEDSAIDLLPEWARSSYLVQRGGEVETTVRVMAERRLNAVIVSGPASVITLAEQMVRELDIERDGLGSDRVVRVIALRAGDAAEAQRTLETIFAEDDDGVPGPSIAVDRAANAVIVRGSAAQVAEVESVLLRLDDAASAGSRQLRTLQVDRARTNAGELARVLQEVLARREGLTVEIISADELLAPATPREEPAAPGDEPMQGPASRAEPPGISGLGSKSESGWLSAVVGAVVLAQADQEMPGRSADIVIAVDEQSGTLIFLGAERVSDRVIDLAREIVAELPAEPGRVRVVELPDGVDSRLVAQTVSGTIRQVGRSSERNPGGFAGAVSVAPDPAGGALVVWANDTDFGAIRQLIASLAGAGVGETMVSRVYALENVPAASAAQALRDLFGTNPRGFQARRLAALRLADGDGVASFDPTSLRLAVAPGGTGLIAVMPEAAADVVDDFVAMLDQTPSGSQLVIRRYGVEATRAREIASTLQRVFDAKRQGPSSRDSLRPIFMPEPSGNAMLVTASASQHDEIGSVLTEIAAAEGEDVRVVTVPLDAARASEVAQALTRALPASVRVTITPVARSNTLLLTGSEDAIAAAMERIREIDQEPTRTLQEFRRIQLTHAMADDVYFLLTQVVRNIPRVSGETRPSLDFQIDENVLLISAPADRMEELVAIVAELDVPSDTGRTTEFVTLTHADAEQAESALSVFFGSFAPEAATPADRNATVLADASANALIISADERTWPRIRALLATIDTEELDNSRRMEVMPLRHADARSVARALSEGFSAPLAGQLARERAGRSRNDDERGETLESLAAILGAEDRPTVSAEPQTNSLIVFAVPRELERIRSLVTQLDVPEFVKMPPARVVPLAAGRASAIAETIRAVFAADGSGSSRSLAIVGDDAAGALIVRAEGDELERVLALAESLEAEADRSLVIPRVIVLRSAQAMRVRDLLRSTLGPVAQSLGETLVVEADRSRNALVVSASQRMSRHVDDLVLALDGEPSGDAGVPGDEADVVTDADGTVAVGDGVSIVSLEHHDPAAMIDLLTRLNATEPAGDGPGVVRERVRLSPVAAGNGIAIAGAQPDREAVRELAESLDAAVIAQAERVEFVALRTADANRVAETLLAMLGGGRVANGSGPGAALAEQVRRLAVARGDGALAIDLSRPIRLTVDAASNTLVVASTRANTSAIVELAMTLDRLPVGEAVMVRFFPLENAAAARLKTLIDGLFASGEALRRVPGTSRTAASTTATGRALEGSVHLGVDERTNALVAAGPEDSVALVEVLVRDLDRASENQWIEPEVFALEHADAPRLADLLRDVLVAGVGNTPEAEALQRQVGRLRVASSLGEGESDSSVADFAVADVFTPLSSLVIRADADSNSLLVVGSPGNLAVVRSLAAMLDVPLAGERNAVRVYPLAHASAERVASLAAQVFRERESAAGVRPEDRLVITPDARTNALIVTTSQRSFAMFESLLAVLDVEQTEQAIGLYVLPVPGADPEELAPRVQRLMRERLAAIARAGSVRVEEEVFTVEADAAAGALVIAASPGNFELASGLVEALMAQGASLEDGQLTALVPVESGRAAEIAETVDDLYVSRERARRGDAAVRVVPSDRLNALLVAGSDADVERVRQIVADLDSAAVAAVQDVRRFELRSANAIELVNLLERVLAGRPISGTRGGEEQALRLRFFREQIEQAVVAADPVRVEADIDGFIRDQVRLTPDQRTNSVIASAPPAIMEMIAEIIDDMDTTTAGSRKIEMFRLTNADARAMSELLRDLFNLSQQGDRLVLIPNAAPEDAGLDPIDTTLTPVPDVRQELAITIDARTNTLLVSGTPEYLDLVREVVVDLDNIEANERESFVYNLRNAKADEVELTLQGYFEGEAERIRALLGPDQAGSALRQLEQEVTVVGDVASNKLIVSASPRYVETVQSIIEELDATPPQVMIQVLLAEVTLDDSQTWGIDINVGPLGNQQWEGSSTIHGAAGLATAIGVPNLAVATSDFSLLVRALEAQGRLEVLSRPQVTVNNNQPASIQVGDNVAIIEGVERLDNGNTRSDVTRRDVGIILNVTPSISADGFVRMDIVPEISTVSQRTTQISEDFEAPIINVRQVDTTVTVRDGETVIIGGLIQTIEEERHNKVPFIGDIPVIGLPFRTSRTERIRTELMVILTPVVVPGDGADGLRRLNLARERAIDGFSNPAGVRSQLANPPTLDRLRELGDSDRPMDVERWPVPIDDSPYPRSGGGR